MALGHIKPAALGHFARGHKYPKGTVGLQFQKIGYQLSFGIFCAGAQLFVQHQSKNAHGDRPRVGVGGQLRSQKLLELGGKGLGKIGRHNFVIRAVVHGAQTPLA